MNNVSVVVGNIHLICAARYMSFFLNGKVQLRASATTEEGIRLHYFKKHLRFHNKMDYVYRPEVY